VPQLASPDSWLSPSPASRNKTEAGLSAQSWRVSNRLKNRAIQGKVLAVRRLPSGDVVITTDTEETKKQLEKDGGWLTAVGQTAQVSRRKSPEMVHGTRIATDCSNQREPGGHSVDYGAECAPLNKAEIHEFSNPKGPSSLTRQLRTRYYTWRPQSRQIFWWMKVTVS
jgi:hypothetical protein